MSPESPMGSSGAGSGPTALLVVEPDFLREHVGVRRVILYYWQQLLAAGFTVRLAAPLSGKLAAAAPIDLTALLKRLRSANQSDEPCWTSEDPVYRPPVRPAAVEIESIDWNAGEARPEAYDISIISNPWLCARGLPQAAYTAGIVHDLVPNLLACGALSFGAEVDIFRFAWEHDLGAQFYLENVRSILCVSRSTRSDFLAFYGVEHADRVHAAIPFQVGAADLASSTATVAAAPRDGRKRVLLVNVLDPRKNFRAAAGALKRAAGSTSFDVQIVGRERMPIAAVLDFLHDLRSAGLHVEWYAGASDDRLTAVYGAADLLLFPSFYEGLGLPILEAQSHGVPALTSDTSSCVEINLNTSLCVAPDDVEGFATRIVAVLGAKAGISKGNALRARLAESLDGANRILDVLGRSGAAESRWSADSASLSDTID